MRNGFILQDVWTPDSLLKVNGMAFQSQIPLVPGQWAVGVDIVTVTRCPGGFRVNNSISGASVMCTKVAERVGVLWQTTWRGVIENPDCVPCYEGAVASQEAGEVHESVLWEGGVIVTPHGWGRDHVVELQVSTVTGKQFYVNTTMGGWHPVPRA